MQFNYCGLICLLWFFSLLGPWHAPGDARQLDSRIFCFLCYPSKVRQYEKNSAFAKAAFWFSYATTTKKTKTSNLGTIEKQTAVLRMRGPAA